MNKTKIAYIEIYNTNNQININIWRLVNGGGTDGLSVGTAAARVARNELMGFDNMDSLVKKRPKVGTAARACHQFSMVLI